MIPPIPEGSSWLRVTAWDSGDTEMEWTSKDRERYNGVADGQRSVSSRVMLFDLPHLFGYLLLGTTATIYYVHKDLLEPDDEDDPRRPHV